MKKILIADDERPIRILLKGTIEILDDVEIIEASDGEEALKKAKEARPDLAILDMMMPGLTGLEVCAAIKSDDSLEGIRIIMLTAKGPKSDIDDAIGAGADQYILKPFSPAELIEAIEGMLYE